MFQTNWCHPDTLLFHVFPSELLLTTTRVDETAAGNGSTYFVIRLTQWSSRSDVERSGEITDDYDGVG